ncbi:hypothetical protein D3C87_1579670 [compost metagenome]
MQVGDDAGQVPVGFLRPGCTQVTGTQTCLDVADGYLAIEGGEGGNEAGGGVAVYQHDIRMHPLVGFVEMPQQLFGETVEGLALGHHLQVFIDRQLERVEDLLEHFPVLACGADVQGYTWPIAQDPCQGGHLDGLRTRTENHHDFK